MIHRRARLPLMCFDLFLHLCDDFYCTFVTLQLQLTRFNKEIPYSTFFLLLHDVGTCDNLILHLLSIKHPEHQRAEKRNAYQI